MHHAYLRSHTSREKTTGAGERERERERERGEGDRGECSADCEGPYLCKCPRTRVAPRAAFPARYFDRLKLTSLRSSLSLPGFSESSREME